MIGSFPSALFCFVCLFFCSLLEPFYINEYMTIALFYEIINFLSIDKIYIKNFLALIFEVMFHSFSGGSLESIICKTEYSIAGNQFTNKTHLFLPVYHCSCSRNHLTWTKLYFICGLSQTQSLFYFVFVLFVCCWCFLAVFRPNDNNEVHFNFSTPLEWREACILTWHQKIRNAIQVIGWKHCLASHSYIMQAPIPLSG